MSCSHLVQFISRNVQLSDTPVIQSLLQEAHGGILMRSLGECVLLMRMGTTIEYFDEVITQRTFDLCLNDSSELSELSMPDLVDLARSLSRLHAQNHVHRKDLVGHQILKEVKNRLHNVTNAPFYALLLQIIGNLTLINVHDLEIMENLFRSEFLSLMHRNKRVNALWLYQIDGYNRINLKHIYRGPHLPQDYLTNVKFLNDFIPDQKKRFHKRHRFFYAMEDVIGGLFAHYSYAHALPFYKNAGNLDTLNHSITLAIIWK